MTVKRIVNLVVDDSGQDLIEYAVTSGIVTVGTVVFSIVFILYVRFLYFNAAGNPGGGVQAIWEPCAPGGTCAIITLESSRKRRTASTTKLLVLVPVRVNPLSASPTTLETGRPFPAHEKFALSIALSARHSSLSIWRIHFPSSLCTTTFLATPLRARHCYHSLPNCTKTLSYMLVR